MTAAKKSNDELLIENALLKYHEESSRMLDLKLEPIVKALREQEQRLIAQDMYKVNYLQQYKTEVKEALDIHTLAIKDINDVLKPFRTVRERAWISIVFASLGATAVGSGSLLMIKELLNK